VSHFSHLYLAERNAVTTEEKHLSYDAVQHAAHSIDVNGQRIETLVKLCTKAQQSTGFHMYLHLAM
jgi:hypothetical protein